MEGKTASEKMLTLLVIGMFTLAFNVQPVKAEPTTIIYSTIQEAINNADDGDIIYVETGTYYESIVINKTISLIGENKNTTVISGFTEEYQTFGALVTIETSNATVNGFTIRDRKNGGGIFLQNAYYNNISNNIIMNHEAGGIYIKGSSNNFISGNIISDSFSGINLDKESVNNTLRNNTLVNNDRNLNVLGYYNDIDSSNTVSGKSVYYWINQKDKQIPSDAGYVALVNSTNIIVKNLTITHNEGVVLAYTTNSTIENVSVSNSYAGIRLDHSNNNIILGCTLTRNFDGIRLDSSKRNKITGNTISNNWNEGIALISSNENTVVNNTITVDKKYSYSLLITKSTENLIFRNNIFHRYGGEVFLPNPSLHNQWDNGLEGNYWSDYNGTDVDGDGIGDVPYINDANNQDRYPLINLLAEAPDSVPPAADAGENQTVAENTHVEFDGSKSYDNVGITNYEWDFGDGTTRIGMTVNRTYVQVGNHTVILTVTDGRHNSGSTSIIIEVLVDTDGDGTADKFDTDDDGDGMPDEWEIENGLNPLDSLDKDRDPDGDWFSNIEEHQWSMNPRSYNPWKINFTIAIVTMVITIPLTIIIAFILYRKKRASWKQRI